jgi:hypothetical protein
MDFHHLMIGSWRKATKLAWTKCDPLSFDLKNKASAKDKIALITFLMSVREWIIPTFR